MNVKLLRKVKRWILAEPKRFYMPDILRLKKGKADLLDYDDGSERDVYRPFPRCGTAGCYAGWICVLSGEKENAGADVAARLVGLTHEEGERLFFNAPLGFQDIWKGDGSRKTALLAAKRIEHFIKTKGNE